MCKQYLAKRRVTFTYVEERVFEIEARFHGGEIFPSEWLRFILCGSPLVCVHEGIPLIN